MPCDLMFLYLKLRLIIFLISHLEMPPKAGKKGKKGGKKEQDSSDMQVPGTPEPSEKEKLLQLEYIYKTLHNKWKIV